MQAAKEIDALLETEACSPESIPDSHLEFPLRDNEAAFQLALRLRCSTSQADKLKAIKIFQQLITIPDFGRECYYFLSLTYYSLQEFARAREFCEELYRNDPESDQVRHLHSAIVYQCKEVEARANAAAKSVGVGIGIGVLAIGISALMLLKQKR